MSNRPKVLLSFLGTNDYLEANYIYQENLQDKELFFVSRYAQEALLKSLVEYYPNAQDWQINVFLTEDARKNHFMGREGRKKLVDQEGYAPFRNTDYLNTPDLRELLETQDIAGTFQAFDIPEGLTKADVWQIFQTFYESIPENATVFFDVTHSFRSIPMLGIVALNYARLLKNIEIGGIYYAAFEILGPAYKVVQEIPDPVDRKVEFLQLKELLELQYLTLAAADFLHHGKTQKLAHYAQQQSHEKLAQQLEHFEDLLTTNRLEEIKKGNIFTDLRSDLKKLKGRNQPTANPAFDRVLDSVGEKLKPFKRNDFLHNGLQAVRLCLNHNLIQQALTLLQETIVGHIYDTIKNHYQTPLREAEAHDVRQDILWWLSRDEGAMKDKSLKGRLEQVEWAMAVRKTGQIKELRYLRNDINHAGYGTDRKRTEQDFKAFLEEILKSVQSIPL